MRRYYGVTLKPKVRELRKNMTDAERRLWRAIRCRQLNNLQFFRQKPLGQYIVDFYCPIAKLILEIDGSPHYTNEGIAKDKQRDEYLTKQLKLKILRFTNIEVSRNIEGVVLKIMQEAKK